MSTAFPQTDAMIGGKLSSVHVLIKLRALHRKKKDGLIDILTAAYKFIHKMMGMRGTMGSRVLSRDEEVIHLMHTVFKEAAWILKTAIYSCFA